MEDEKKAVAAEATRDDAEKKMQFMLESLAKVPLKDGWSLVLTSNALGRHDECLGELLMENLLRALGYRGQPPEFVLLLNSAVWLALEGASASEFLLALESRGSLVLCCGTSLDYYHQREQLAVGSIATVYELLDALEHNAKVIVF